MSNNFQSALILRLMEVENSRLFDCISGYTHISDYRLTYIQTNPGIPPKMRILAKQTTLSGAIKHQWPNKFVFCLAIDYQVVALKFCLSIRPR